MIYLFFRALTQTTTGKAAGILELELEIPSVCRMSNLPELQLLTRCCCQVRLEMTTCK